MKPPRNVIWAHLSPSTSHWACALAGTRAAPCSSLLRSSLVSSQLPTALSPCFFNSGWSRSSFATVSVNACIPAGIGPRALQSRSVAKGGAVGGREDGNRSPERSTAARALESCWRTFTASSTPNLALMRDPKHFMNVRCCEMRDGVFSHCAVGDARESDPPADLMHRQRLTMKRGLHHQAHEKVLLCRRK
eukprot:scaffold7011_cov112-Isochrysis_galbana.AAC.25